MAVIRSIRGGTAGLNEEERLTIARLLIKAGYRGGNDINHSESR